MSKGLGASAGRSWKGARAVLVAVVSEAHLVENGADYAYQNDVLVADGCQAERPQATPTSAMTMQARRTGCGSAGSRA